MRYLANCIAVALFTCVFVGCYKEYIPGDKVTLKNGITATVRWQRNDWISCDYEDDGRTYSVMVHKRVLVPQDPQTEEPTRWTIDD